MICSLKREVQDPVPAAMAESVAVASEASAAAVEATASSQREKIRQNIYDEKCCEEFPKFTAFYFHKEGPT